MKRINYFFVTALLILFPVQTFSEVLGDINSDGQIGLQEAIYALQTVAGIKPHTSINDSLSYEFPSQFSDDGRNIILDGNNVIMAGGKTGRDGGATHNGSPLFSDKVLVLNLSNGEVSEYTMKSGGRGNSAIIHKVGTDKYLIGGGYQYTSTLDLLDIKEGSISSINIDLSISGPTGYNITPFYTDRQAQVALPDGKVVFFGFNNGLYAMNEIMIFNPSENQVYLSHSKLSLPRSNATAHLLNDGRVLVAGGWDGTAQVSADSATRRADIYDPSDDSILRVSDICAPISYGQVIAPPRKNDFDICIGDYSYSISSNAWTSGCNIGTDEEFRVFINGERCIVGQMSSTVVPGAIFLGKSLSGDLVFFNNATFSTEFSDKCDCYPLEKPSRITIYDIAETQVKQ